MVIPESIRNTHASGLLGVEQQFQTLHHALDRFSHRRRRLLAKDDDVIGVVDDVRLEPLGMPQHLPAHYEATHVQVAQQRRHRRPLRGPLPLPTRPVRAAGAASPVVFLDRHLQPRLHPSQHPPVTYPAGDAVEQFGVRSLAEVVRQIRVHSLAVARIDQPMRLIERIVCASPWPIGVLLRGQVRFDYRRQHQQRRRLRHPGPVGRECPVPDTSRVVSSQSTPAEPPWAGRSLPSTPAPVPQTTAPRRAPRCSPPSRRPPQAPRRCGEPHPRRPTTHRRATPCRSAYRTDNPQLPSLSHGATPGVSELVPGLSGSCQSPSPFLLLALLSNQGPFPPPALPGFHGTTSLSAIPNGPACPSQAAGWHVPCHRRGFPCCVHPPPPCVPPPLPRRNRSVRPSLASRPMPAFPEIQAGRLPHHKFRGLLGVHSRCGPHGR